MTPLTLPQWRAEFARVAEMQAQAAIRAAKAEPGTDCEATIMRLTEWRAKLGRAA